MMFTKQRLILLFSLFLLPNALNAGTIDKAFKALQQYNYFDAKALFEKALKKEPSAANYGLAVIYSRTDNPFHNLDSAFSKIQISEATYAAIKEKTKVKYKVYQFDYLAIVTLRSAISTVFFQQALATISEAGMDNYQRKHPWAQERFTAIHLRDSIGFKAAGDKSTSAAYSNFLKTYPESEYAARAQKEFYRLQYLEQTTSGTLSTYMSFEKSFPGNPYVADAQDQIYRLATVQNTIEAFAAFIKAYPANRNVDQAWRRLYQLYMSDYSPSRVEAFQKEYPDYPFKQELARDKELAGSVLIPYKQESLFGWMSLNGIIVIPAAYESVGFFKDGLAWVEKNGKYGYVNKANELVIDFKYTGANDFEKGRAIVEQDEKFGIIDRSGALIFLPEFNDLGQFSEDLIYVQRDSLYGYFDQFGFQRIQPEYNEAYSFSGGKARVKVGELDAFINQYGAFIVPPLYEEVEFFNDSILTFVDGEFMGLMDRKGKIIAPATYEAIGAASNERGIFITDEMVGYFSGKGAEIIPPIYDLFPNILQQGAFVGNYAKVLKGDKFGLIDRAGKVIIPFQYTNMGDVGTLIAVQKGGKWGYVDLTNKMLIQPTYEYAETFVDGLGIVELLTLQGAINAKGQVVIPLEHTEVKRLDKGHYLVSRGSKYGVYSDKGELLVPMEYGQIRKVQGDFLLLSKGAEMHYLYLPENRLIQPKIQ
ncbi:MAG: hypothetical protein A3D31_08600 [Candidatus Fluviicola riflensis]|nr:MAG: hypothetical protein CHH17_06395 [Candidatus Fluviicola riflensis]OGS79997.1 MAG: hypothetical protein A3D31_08600 [Candidatus Fluviicola riflensis]OGS82512.1 MAG: hypothetical protein A2724_17545 [Fluviicola sp. RIFCSPHIGHO2_01_FULL_43_53]OGS88176.1 MAG: hypothetical protein A3E30_14980 [Fluviicola sp. RIFCSPHIGHO2_12_FULL_43_24]